MSTVSISDIYYNIENLSTNRLRHALTFISILFWIPIIIYALTQTIPRAQLGIIFLGGIITIYVLDECITSIENNNPADVVLLLGIWVIALSVISYILVNYWALSLDRVGYAYDYEYIFAGLFTVVICYLTFREFGYTFLVLLLVSFTYALFGPYFPGVSQHAGADPYRVLQLLVLEIEGFFGSLTRLVAAWIAPFLLFAGLLRGYGAFDVIQRVSIRISKHIRSGVAQGAVIASFVIGSVNGSQTANAGITGSFTIPMMQESGIEPETAGGIEAVASTGGQILPPVMGASAFLIASLLGESYIDIVIAGLIPAVIFYISVAIAVHYNAIREIDRVTVDPTTLLDGTMDSRELWIQLVRFGLPIVVLVYLLGVVQYTVMTSALYTCVVLFVVGIGLPLARAARDDLSAIKSHGKTAMINTFEGARYGAIVLAPIAIVVAAINGIVDILLMTGVPSKLTLILFDLSGGILIVAVIMSMVICMLLGLGMPTVAAYLIVALLVAPTLINQFLIPELAAHFFVFYSAILAGITPPVATAVAVTCGISGAGFWRSCLQAIKIALPLFFLPFVFIYHPEILLQSFDLWGITSGAIVLLGAISLVHGLNYYEPIIPGAGAYVDNAIRIGYCLLGLGAMLWITTLGRLIALGGITVLALMQFQQTRIATIIQRA